MVKKLILLNLALLGLASWLVYYVDTHFKKDARRGDLSKVLAPLQTGKKSAVKPTDPGKDKPANGTAPAPSAFWDQEYKVVADKNLFSEDRSLAPPPPAAPPPVIPDLTPKPVLIAIIKADNKLVALVESSNTATPTPGPPQGRYPRPSPNPPHAGQPPVMNPTPSGPRQALAQQLEVGQDYHNGYKVTEIADTSVTFTYGDNKRRETVQLYEKTKAQRPGRMPPAFAQPQTSGPAGQVVSIPVGGGQPGSPTPGGVPSSVRPGVQPNTLPGQQQSPRPGVNPVNPINPANPAAPATPATTPAVTSVARHRRSVRRRRYHKTRSKGRVSREEIAAVSMCTEIQNTAQEIECY